MLAGPALACGLAAGEPGIEIEPLAAARGDGAGPMFRPVSAEDSGIRAQNPYDDPAMWGARWREFLLGAIGTGVTVADYDRDGRPDLFVVAKTGGDRLFRNLGGWRFEDVTAAAGLAAPPGPPAAWHAGATFADVNNDGWPDLYVLRQDAPNRLYVNRGDGTFREEAAARGLAVVDASAMAAFADYDRDGALDLFLLTNASDLVRNPEGEKDRLFRNRGDGTFEETTAAAGIFGAGQGHSATWWDCDEDGWPDLYVANDFAPADQLYHNNGDGTFTVTLGRAVPVTPNSSMGADVGDVNNDGRVDLFVGDMAGTTHEKDQRGMVDGRAEARRRPDPVGTAQALRNTLFLGTGTGRCLEVAHYAGLAATDWTWAPRWEDFDNDGWVDLFVTTGMVRELHNSDLIARTAWAESPAERAAIIRAGPVLAERNLAYRNRGGLAFAEAGAAWGLDQSGVSFGAATADFDGDGDLDLVFTNFDAPPTVLRNDGATGGRLVVRLRGTVSNRDGVGALVRLWTSAGPQVRPLVLARGYLSASEPVLHFGLGAAERADRLVVEWPSGLVQEFRDLPANRRVTVTEPGSRARVAPALPADPPPPSDRDFIEVRGQVGLVLPAEAGDEAGPARPLLLPIRPARGSRAVAWTDVNRDGAEDLVVGGAGRIGPSVLVAQAGPRFAGGGSLPDGLPRGGPVLAFEADGREGADLLVTPGEALLAGDSKFPPPVLLLNEGRGNWLPAGPGALPDWDATVGAVAAADFDRDGRLDLFLGARTEPAGYLRGARSALWRNEGGRFADVTDSIAPALRRAGAVTAALWSDLDDDGWVDLVVASDWGPVRWFRNERGTRFDERTEPAGFTAAGTGWWTALASADLNGDGRPDIVAGNVGLNTRYRASRENPAVLYVGSFEPGGPEVAIEAHRVAGREVPWRGRREMASAIPSVLRRLPGNNAYARASLAEIIGADGLARAARLEATELRSGVFLSQPGGRWEFRPLPAAAQFAPLQGIAMADLNGDGRTDLFAPQNSYAPVPEIGRFTGGLGAYLQGDGRGGWEERDPARSGLVVTGDAKAAAVGDIDADGWADVLVMRRDGEPLAFRNNGREGGNCIRVLLAGRDGNPSAIGARWTVTFADGSARGGEVQAHSSGSGQSSVQIFLGFATGNPPRRLSVRWPDGRETAHEPLELARAVRIERP